MSIVVSGGRATAGHGAQAVRDAIAAKIATLPGILRRSLTWDQGAEMAHDALCVPKTSSKSCDQAIFVDQATGASLSSDAVLVEIDRFG
jgi:hypothetical protein